MEYFGNPSKWIQEYQENFETMAPKQLFYVPYSDEVTAKDVKKAYEVFEHYIGSVENINEDNLPGMFDLFTEY